MLRGRGRGAVRGTWASPPREGHGAAVGGPGAQPSSQGLPSRVVPGQLGVRAELKTGSSPRLVQGWQGQRAQRATFQPCWASQPGCTAGAAAPGQRGSLSRESGSSALYPRVPRRHRTVATPGLSPDLGNDYTLMYSIPAPGSGRCGPVPLLRSHGGHNLALVHTHLVPTLRISCLMDVCQALSQRCERPTASYVNRRCCYESACVCYVPLTGHVS